MNVRHGSVPTSLGDLLLVAEGDSLAGLYFPDHWYPPKPEQIGESVELPADAFLSEVAAQLTDYLAGKRQDFDLPLRTHGDVVEEQVWALLREIPRGVTTTYGALAERLGNRNLAQRVGQAVGHNPISIVIPCHRVVGADGSMTGFAGGLPRKRALLSLEEPVAGDVGRLF